MMWLRKCSTTKLLLLVVVAILFYIIDLNLNLQSIEAIFPLNKNNRSNSDIMLTYSYEDLEKHLCKSAVNWENKTLYKPGLRKCPHKGIVSIVTGGRTGNLLWEYATVWAVARRTGLQPYIPRCIKNNIEQSFQQLSLPSFEDILHCPVQFATYVKSFEEWTSPGQSIILLRYTIQPKLVLTWLEDIVHEFRFKKILRDKAQAVIASFVRNLPRKDYTFVGVHVRRADYINYLDRKYRIKPVGPQFFINAMNYFKGKYTNCLFIFISDDPSWCSKQFSQRKDVIIASDNTRNPATLDLAIMASCNHTIFDYGTFGEWGSIFAGGETVYNNMIQNIRKGTGRAMKNWTMMS